MRFNINIQMKNTVQAALKDRISDDTSKREEKVRQMKESAKAQEKETKEKIQSAIDKAR